MNKVVAFVQGASRGIGLHFAKDLAKKPNAFVIASCRDPDNAVNLQALSNQVNNVDLLRIDVTNEDDIKHAAVYIKEKYNSKLDLLINIAGMLSPSGRGETSLREVSVQALEETFKVNTFGPLLVAKHFGQFLQNGNGGFGAKSESEKLKHSGVLVNMSAKVGSIGDNSLGGWYSYRLSKAALNMVTKNLSIELGRGRKKVICVSLHPGSVDTDLSRPYLKSIPTERLFSPEYSVSCLMNVIDNLNVHDTGKFFSWDGSELPY
ncbi:uncharacterized protein LOC106469171 isoform X1 [Limulus polyphemus]|uniref:Uncharacterized protein LOC106469171 isoform X1 n=1 Tax=Limulus polyphemus TaxID=6850 RepID=A0ABM1BMN9_LIMPO|nr:uncharacterized protein LOC106469171 isoform X1 [Limulus polyphemus]